MSVLTADEAREFEVETNFQRAARRPGGIPRDKALRSADAHIRLIKPTFASWLDDELRQLKRIIPNAEAVRPQDPAWLDAVEHICHRLADVASTMDYQFVSFVANNFRTICEAIRAGAQCEAEIITCHMNALLLGSQVKYRKMTPEDLPELSDGLRRVLESRRLTASLDKAVAGGG